MNALLTVSGLSRRFGGLKAVDDLSFTVPAGEITGLLGPNGSGKTTVMNLVSGNLKPDSGSIRLGQREISGRAPHRLAREGVARTFQLVRVVPEMTGAENVMAGLAFGRRSRFGVQARTEAETLMERVGIAHLRDTPAGDVTYIDQKRLELARALALDPHILLLDEWLAGLNATELRVGIALLQSLRADGATILMVEHVMDAIRALCGHCVVMNAGAKIAEGPPAAVLEDPAVISAYLGDGDA